MKILFTDFDGVFHPVSTITFDFPNATVEDALANPAFFRYAPILVDLLDGTDTNLVVHSSWRFNAHDSDLRRLPGPLAVRFAGSTPQGARYQSIRDAVKFMELQPNDYRILDDAPWEFPGNVHSLIVCQPNHGLDDPAVRAKITEWLHG